jgi:hypothetical protein
LATLIDEEERNDDCSVELCGLSASVETGGGYCIPNVLNAAGEALR